MSLKEPGSSPRLEEAVEAFVRAERLEQARRQPSHSTGRRPAASPPPPASDLASAYADVVAQERARAKARPERTVPWRRIVVALLLLTLSGGTAWAWIAAPHFFRPVVVRPAEPQSALLAQRQLLGVAFQIEEFRVTRGRLPVSLDELGMAVPGSMSFLPMPDGRFELRIGQGVHAKVLRGGGGAEPEVQ